MQMVLFAGAAVIPYTVRPSKRARHARLTVYPGGSVVLTVPQSLGAEKAERFVSTKAAWLARAVAKMKTVAPHRRQKSSVKEFRILSTGARTLIEERIRHFNQQYGFSFGRITIRNQKTRWGSCNRRGDLSFNYRLALLPPALADYVIVHELCHLQEFNHSARFWRLVGRTIVHPRAMRRQLQSYDAGRL